MRGHRTKPTIGLFSAGKPSIGDVVNDILRHFATLGHEIHAFQDVGNGIGDVADRAIRGITRFTAG